MSTIKDTPNFIPLSKTETKTPQKDTRNEKMLEAAKSFENQLLREMIREMRKTVPKDELNPETMADDIFRSQLDDQYADMWVDQGGVGIADVIYQQLQDRYAPPTQFRKQPGEFIPVPPNTSAPVSRGTSTVSGAPVDRPQDILGKKDRDLFVAKKMQDGFDIKSREPLPESVDIKAPMSGIVLQAATLEDGRQALVIQHDQGLVSQIVHTGGNRVKSNTHVAAGEVIARLPASRKGELSNIFFGLRKAAKLD